MFSIVIREPSGIIITGLHSKLIVSSPFFDHQCGLHCHSSIITRSHCLLSNYVSPVLAGQMNFLHLLSLISLKVIMMASSVLCFLISSPPSHLCFWCYNYNNQIFLFVKFKHPFVARFCFVNIFRL